MATEFPLIGDVIEIDVGYKTFIGEVESFSKDERCKDSTIDYCKACPGHVIFSGLMESCCLGMGLSNVRPSFIILCRKEFKVPGELFPAIF